MKTEILVVLICKNRISEVKTQKEQFTFCFVFNSHNYFVAFYLVYYVEMSTRSHAAD